MISSFFIAACLLVGPVRSENISIVFQEETSRELEMRILDLHHVGHLDANGYFYINHSYKPCGFISYNRLVINSAVYDNMTFQQQESQEVYRLQEGQLTLGTILTSGLFCANPGFKPIDFKDYRYSPDTPPIYNLPGKFVVKINLSHLRSASADKGAPLLAHALAAMLSLTTGDRYMITHGCVYFEKARKARAVTIIQDDRILDASIDRRGEVKILSSQKIPEVRLGPFPRYANHFMPSVKLVYEYRHGLLIPGRIADSGHFVPSTERPNISFRHYFYTNLKEPIWNLPGEIVTYEQAWERLTQHFYRWLYRRPW
jgi:hypothetical protein